jgi:hypothetical protein|nr:MAG TPA: hypothetical protein [Caudoviricetes sp.]
MLIKNLSDDFYTFVMNNCKKLGEFENTVTFDIDEIEECLIDEQISNKNILDDFETILKVSKENNFKYIELGK